jgi:hypothetical protein
LPSWVGLDAFHMLVGYAPEHITDAAEGALLGLAVGFGPLSQAVTGGIEGLLFGLGVAGAIILIERRLAA